MSRNGYQITNAAGNVVDLDGNEIDGAFLNNYPGFPGFDNINAAQTLAYMSDMLESGVPGRVRVHSRPARQRGHPGSVERVRRRPPKPSAAGAPATSPRPQYYNAAFGHLLQAAGPDGITPAQHPVRVQFRRG